MDRFALINISVNPVNPNAAQPQPLQADRTGYPSRIKKTPVRNVTEPCPNVKDAGGSEIVGSRDAFFIIAASERP